MGPARVVEGRGTFRCGHGRQCKGQSAGEVKRSPVDLEAFLLWKSRSSERDAPSFRRGAVNSSPSMPTEHL